MSEAQAEGLAGGLIPIGAQKSIQSLGESSLSGGLVPLGPTRSRPSTRSSSTLRHLDSSTCGDEWPDGDGDEDMEGSHMIGLKKDAQTSAVRSAESGKRRGSRRGRKQASRGPDSSSTTHKDRSPRPSSSVAEKSKGDGDDDEYMFMGAMTGRRDRRSSDIMAEASALLLDSDDTLGLMGATGPSRKKADPIVGKLEDLDRDGAESGKGAQEAHTINETIVPPSRKTNSSHAESCTDTEKRILGPEDLGHAAYKSGPKQNAVQGEARVPRGVNSSPDEANPLRRKEIGELDGQRNTTTVPDVPSTQEVSSQRGENFTSHPVWPSPEGGGQEVAQETVASRRPGIATTSSQARRPSSEMPKGPRLNLSSNISATSKDRMGATDPEEALTSAREGEALHVGAPEDDCDGVVSTATQESSRFNNHGGPRKEKIPFAVAKEYAVSARAPESMDRSAGEMTSVGGASTGKVAPRRSVLGGTEKSRHDRPKPRGVTFDDDLKGLDALDILPDSDDDDPPAKSSSLPQSLQDTDAIASATASSVEADRSPDKLGLHADREGSNRHVGRHLEGQHSPGKGETRRKLTEVPQTEAKAAADSSSLVQNEPTPSLSGLEERSGSVLSQVLERTSSCNETTSTVLDEAKLNLALGFTPSSFDGGRRQRRTIPARGRRRQNGGSSPGATEVKTRVTNSERLSESATLDATTMSPPKTELSPLDGASTIEKIREVESHRSRDNDKGTSPSVMSSAQASVSPNDSSACKATELRRGALPVSGTSAVLGAGLDLEATSVKTLGAIVGSRASSEATNNSDVAHSGECTGSTASSSQPEASKGISSVDVSVLSSLERQLVILTRDREDIVTRHKGEKEKLEREIQEGKNLLAAAEARTSETDAALAAARSRIRQLETEVAELNSRLASVEAKTAAEARVEQAMSLQKVADAEARYQNEMRELERQHEEALCGVKRLHLEELEDVRRRSADARTLETLARQVHASAGALKVLQAEIMERKGAAEVSRESQVEARERLVKELEGSAKRAQQTAEDEVQRLQGTLMAMDQVMRGVRGHNAGERERLRQEHLRIETLQSSMIAEVEAMRQGLEGERRRLSERNSMLTRELREREAAARVETDRLAQERFKLDTERETFAALQVSASQAAEATTRRLAEEEERLKLARQKLEKETSSLETRHAVAKSDFLNAEEARADLGRARADQEREARRLRSMAAELEQALEEVRMRNSEADERQLEIEDAMRRAMEAEREASKEKGRLQARMAQVEDTARRQDMERTGIAQARAQSATELSESRRLKSQLARTIRLRRRHPPHEAQMLGIPHTIGASALSRVQQPWDERLGVRSKAQGNFLGVGAAMDHGGADVIPGWRSCLPTPPGGEPGAKGTQGTRGARGMVCLAHSRSATGPKPEHRSSSGNVSTIPNTGIAAAETALRAAVEVAPFPGLNIANELGRLARRAAEAGESTRRQNAFLLHARSSSAPFLPGSVSNDRLAYLRSPSIAVVPGTGRDVSSPTSTGGYESGLQRSAFGWSMPGASRGSRRGSSEVVTGSRSGGLAVEREREQTTGISGSTVSRTVKEQIDGMERDCARRATALQDETALVEALGGVGGEYPVSVR